MFSLSLKHRVALLGVMGLLSCPVYAVPYAPAPIKTQVGIIDQLIADNHYHDALIKSNEALTYLAIGGYSNEEYVRWTGIVKDKILVINTLAEVGSR